MNARVARDVLLSWLVAAPVAAGGLIAGAVLAVVDSVVRALETGRSAAPGPSAFAIETALLAITGALLGAISGGLVAMTKAFVLHASHRAARFSLGVRAGSSALLLAGVEAPALGWLWERPTLDSPMSRVAAVAATLTAAAALGTVGAVAWEERRAAKRLAGALSFACGVGLFVSANAPLVRPYHWLSTTGAILGVLVIADPLGAMLHRRWSAGRTGSLVFALVVLSGVTAAAGLRNVRTRQVIVTRTLVGGDLLALAQGLRLWTPSRISVSTEPVSRPQPAASRFSTPNAGIVLITVDSLRATHLGTYGGPHGLSPNIDRFMQSAVVVDHGYAQFPSTTGSLPSLQTGAFPWQPVLGWRDTLLRRPTLAQRLRSHGYQTAAFFGAWTIRDEDGFFSMDRRRLGFEIGPNTEGTAPARVSAMLEFLGRAPRPFAWIHVMEPHEPYSKHPELKDGPKDPYDNEIAYVDRALGPLFDYLDTRTDLVVWFTADHGEAFGEHAQYHHASSLYDEQIRVPLAVRAPGLAPRRIDGPVQLLDVAPTTLALVGVPARDLDGQDRRAELEGGPNLGPAFAVFDDRMMIATSGGMKLICDAPSDACELYDLRHDPEESSNVYGLGREEEKSLLNTLVHFIAGERSLDPGKPETLDRLLTARRTLERPGRTAAELVMLLGSADAVEREAGARGLAFTPAAATVDMGREALAKGQRDEARAVRSWATIALARASDRDAVRALADLGPEASGDPEIHAWSALARYEAGGASTALEAALMEHPDLRLARAAIAAAKRTGDIRFRSALVRWLLDPDLAEVASDALLALDRTGGVGDVTRALDQHPAPDAEAALIRALAGSSEAARSLGGAAALESLSALARSTDDQSVFGEAALALHSLGHGLTDLAGVASSFRYLPGEKIYRATLVMPDVPEQWVECWIGVKDPTDDVPHLVISVNGERVAEDDPSVPTLDSMFPLRILRVGMNTVDISFAGADLPVRGVVIARPKVGATRGAPPVSPPRAIPH